VSDEPPLAASVHKDIHISSARPGRLIRIDGGAASQLNDRVPKAPQGKVVVLVDRALRVLCKIRSNTGQELVLGLDVPGRAHPHDVVGKQSVARHVVAVARPSGLILDRREPENLFFNLRLHLCQG